MCGVSGVFGSGEEVIRTRIDQMVGCMGHRGPDAAGTIVLEAQPGRFLGLGHNRLAIIDLTDHAAQPMVSGDGRYVLVYNGEVYNYLELADELNYTAGSRSCGDTEVVLAALQRWGPAALNRFNGMWALLLYDRAEGTLLVSRDRFGIKPLYYHVGGAEWYFASEIKAILRARDTRARLNPDVVVPYLTRGLLNFSTGTFFEDVHQVPPASYAVIDVRSQAAFSWQRYWQHPFELGQEPVLGAVSPENIRETFIDAVRLRLRSDVPVGVLLSGGIDSSSIVGAIRELGALENVSVLSVISNDRRSNEEPFIDRMATWSGLVPRKVNVSDDPEVLLERLAEANWYNDEPVSGIADVAHLRLMDLARSLGIKVLLNGQGSDEQLGGYNKFFYFWLQSAIADRSYWLALRTLVQSAVRSDTLYEFRLSEAIRYLNRKWLSTRPYIAPEHQGRDSVEIGFSGSYPHREWLDLVSTSVPTLLHYEDRMSMSQSLEMRVPFLDYRLVECLARVHPSEKFEGGWTKSIFRKAIHGMVPPEIQYRRDKRGFNVPELSWMRGEFAPKIRAAFAGGMAAESLGFIRSEELLRAYDHFIAGKGVLNGRPFFRAYAFEVFARRFSQYIRS